MYPTEHLSNEVDDGTMPENVQRLADAVVGQRIVCVDGRRDALRITLGNGRTVQLDNTDDCCAYTQLESFLLNPKRVDHVITGVGTTGGYEIWHIYADMGDVLALQVGWSAGNPFYYGYGFNITVKEIES